MSTRVSQSECMSPRVLQWMFPVNMSSKSQWPVVSCLYVYVHVCVYTVLYGSENGNIEYDMWGCHSLSFYLDSLCPSPSLSMSIDLSSSVRPFVRSYSNLVCLVIWCYSKSIRSEDLTTWHDENGDSTICVNHVQCGGHHLIRQWQSTVSDWELLIWSLVSVLM